MCRCCCGTARCVRARACVHVCVEGRGDSSPLEHLSTPHTHTSPHTPTPLRSSLWTCPTLWTWRWWRQTQACAATLPAAAASPPRSRRGRSSRWVAGVGGGTGRGECLRGEGMCVNPDGGPCPARTHAPTPAHALPLAPPLSPGAAVHQRGGEDQGGHAHRLLPLTLQLAAASPPPPPPALPPPPPHPPSPPCCPRSPFWLPPPPPRPADCTSVRLSTLQFSGNAHGQGRTSALICKGMQQGVEPARACVLRGAGRRAA